MTHGREVVGPVSLRPPLPGSRIAILPALAMLAALLPAHEGHKALAAKGVRVDATGLLRIDPQAAKAIGLANGTVDFGMIEETSLLSAHLVLPWNRRSYASSQAAGVVTKVLVRLGQNVAAGETLALVQSLLVETLRLELRQAELEEALAEKNLERARSLGEGIVPGRETLHLEAEREDRGYVVATLRSKLRAIGAGAEGAIPVKAPMDGTIVHQDVVVGHRVEPTEHLFELQDLREIWAECDVPENLVARIATGQAARVRAFALPGRSFAGTVGFRALSMDAGESARRVYVPLENADGALLPGMFATAEVVTRRVEDAIVAPAAAIVTDGAERYAFVREEESAYGRKNLVLGSAAAGDLVEVREGLYPGDAVVTTGNHQLSALFVQGTLGLSDEAKRGIAFATKEVDYRALGGVARVNGRVAAPPERTAVATPRIEGKIEKIHVAPGRAVQPGEPLAAIQSLDLQSDILDLIRLDRRRVLLGRQLGYVRALAEKGVPPRKELLRLENEMLELDARFSALRRTLLLTGLDEDAVTKALETREAPSHVTVRSPIAGQVASIRVVLGQVVHPGEALFDIADPSEVWIEGAFFESDLAGLLDGPLSKPTTVRTVAYGDREWRGAIGFVSPSVQGSGRALAGWVVLDNRDGALLPGMHATLLTAEAAPGEKLLAVPLRSIYPSGARRYVFVEGKNAFRRVEIEIGRRDADYGEVLRGLSAGDLVVVSGVNELNNAYSAVR